MLIPWRVYLIQQRIFHPSFLQHRQVLLFLLAFTVFLQPFGSRESTAGFNEQGGIFISRFFSLKKLGLSNNRPFVEVVFVSFAIISTVQST